MGDKEGRCICICIFIFRVFLVCADHCLRRNMSLGQILWATKKADEGGGGRAVNTSHRLRTLVDCIYDKYVNYKYKYKYKDGDNCDEGSRKTYGEYIGPGARYGHLSVAYDSIWRSIHNTQHTYICIPNGSQIKAIRKSCNHFGNPERSPPPLHNVPAVK